jgi:hypothetical protein
VLCYYVGERTGSPVSRTVIGRHKGPSRRMAESPHAGDANQSEADDEDGWAKSSTDETDSYMDHAPTLAFPTPAKRRSSRSGSGKVVPLAEMNVANLC